MSGKRKKQFLAVLLAAVMTVPVLSGCGGENMVEETVNEVELLEPAGISLNYEEAAYRNLYDVSVFGALVCPEVKEYSVGRDGKYFSNYAAIPGDRVEKGQVLIRTDTENLEEQMKNLREKMADDEEEYLEFIKEESEKRARLVETKDYWTEVLDLWAGEAPESEEDFGYYWWARSNFMFYTKQQDARYALEKEDQMIRKRAELYALDSAHNQLLLDRMQEDIDNGTVLSGMNGVLANIRMLSSGTYMNKGAPMVAVADLNKKILKSDFISKTAVGRAQEIYAIINGERYEIEYEPMEPKEYERLKEENDVVYTTFHLQGDTREIEMGSFAAIVLVRDYRENVLTVPQDAVQKAEGVSYVYVLKDNESVYTPVRTGMKDGMYVEILSGVEAGDKILTEKAAKATEKTVTLEMGRVSNEFTASGFLAYPVTDIVRISVDYGTVYFEESYVKQYQHVEAGELIARVRVVPDEAELARTQKSLQREIERLADMQKERENLVKQKDEAAKEGDYSSRYQEAIKAQDKALVAKAEAIQKLQEHIEELNENFAVTEVRAPYKGIITSVPWGLEKGDLISGNQWFARIARMDSGLILLEDKNGILTYGNRARIEYRGEDGSTQTTEGEVVSLNQHSITKALFAGDNQDATYAMVRTTEENGAALAGSTMMEGWWSRTVYKVAVTTRSMDNVLLVPKRAVTASGSTTYVRVVKENGEVVYQSFVAGGSDSTNYWVVEGLTEGMKVCIE